MVEDISHITTTEKAHGNQQPVSHVYQVNEDVHKLAKLGKSLCGLSFFLVLVIFLVFQCLGGTHGTHQWDLQEP